MGRHAADTPPDRPRWLIPVLAIVVALGGSGAWWAISRVTGGSGSSASPSSGPVAPSAAATPCTTPVAVPVAVAGPLVTAVQKAADAAKAAGACATYTVSAAAPAGTAAEIAAGKGPAVWVPDSSIWLTDVTSKAPSVKLAVGPSVAFSPLVLVLPSPLGLTVKTAPAWNQLVSFAVPIQFADPTVSAGSRLGLRSAYAALGASPQTRVDLGAAMIRLSRTKVASDEALFANAVVPTPNPAAFLAEEAVVAAHNRTHPDTPLAVTIPRDGTTAFDHPFVTVGTPSEPVKAAVEALQAALLSDAGKATVAAGGFRSGPTDGTAGVGTIVGGAGGVPTYLADPSTEATVALQRSWAAVSTEMRMIAVVDSSGSMKQPVGATTRMDLAHQAGLVALSAFPQGSVIGLWRFGYHLKPPTQDWEELVPQRPLTESVGDKDQRTLLAEGFAKLAADPRGSTGLFDTVLAAYETAKAGYDSTRVNSVVLLTDGKNEDPGSITIDDLLAKLTAAKDPARPIVVITVAIGPDADADTLKRITTVTGGRSYTATAPEQITGVFVDALLNRS